MDVDFSELSSLAATLDQLNRRIAAMAESANKEHDESLAHELYGIERALSGAQRRIVRLVRANRPDAR